MLVAVCLAVEVRRQVVLAHQPAGVLFLWDVQTLDDVCVILGSCLHSHSCVLAVARLSTLSV